MKIVLGLIMAVSLMFGVVDINSASAKELSSLKGIGMAKAEAIVKFRKGNCFKSVKDLEQIKGIGAKTIANNKKNLKAGKCKK